MKPESKRTYTTTRRRTNDENGGCCSPFNLSSLKHAIEAVAAAKEKSINLASLSAALSAASREMKQRERSQRRRETSKKKKKKKTPKKLMIGTKPETQAELRRWFSNLDKSFKQLSSPKKLNDSKSLICEFNTDFRMNHCADSFRY